MPERLVLHAPAHLVDAAVGGAHDVEGAARYYRIARTVPDIYWWFHSPYERWLPVSFDKETNTGGTHTLAEVWLSRIGVKKAPR